MTVAGDTSELRCSCGRAGRTLFAVCAPSSGNSDYESQDARGSILYCAYVARCAKMRSSNRSISSAHTCDGSCFETERPDVTCK
jgi:hypothetical protein